MNLFKFSLYCRTLDITVSFLSFVFLKRSSAGCQEWLSTVRAAVLGPCVLGALGTRGAPAPEQRCWKRSGPIHPFFLRLLSG